MMQMLNLMSQFLKLNEVLTQSTITSNKSIYSLSLMSYFLVQRAKKQIDTFKRIAVWQIGILIAILCAVLKNFW